MIFYASQIFTTSGGNSNNWFSATIKLEILYIIIDYFKFSAYTFFYEYIEAINTYQ